MAPKIKIKRHGHCTNCSYDEAMTTAADGTERSEDGNAGESEYAAIGRLIINNPDIFGEIEIQHED